MLCPGRTPILRSETTALHSLHFCDSFRPHLCTTCRFKWQMRQGRVKLVTSLGSCHSSLNSTPPIGAHTLRAEVPASCYFYSLVLGPDGLISTTWEHIPLFFSERAGEAENKERGRCCIPGNWKNNRQLSEVPSGAVSHRAKHPFQTERASGFFMDLPCRGGFLSLSPAMVLHQHL